MKFLCVEISKNVKTYINISHIVNIIEFENEDVNPVVLNGLNTETKTMDNFSMKGNGYQKMKSEMLKDSDFFFDAPNIINTKGDK